MIQKLLDISTAYIKPATAIWLDEGVENLIEYKISPKGEYGWFIYTLSEEFPEDTPDELLKLIKYAKKKKCDWLVLDRDGDDDIDELTKYEW